MSDEERAELEAMRAREAGWAAHLDAQDARMREAESAMQQRQAERDAMAAQWAAMQGQVRMLSTPAACNSLLAHRAASCRRSAPPPAGARRRMQLSSVLQQAVSLQAACLLLAGLRMHACMRGGPFAGPCRLAWQKLIPPSMTAAASERWHW